METTAIEFKKEMRLNAMVHQLIKHRIVLWIPIFIVTTFLLASCQSTRSSRCGNFICPAGTVCTPNADSCVLPERIGSCAGAIDESSCAYPDVPDGVCYGNICFPVGCGNAQIEDAEVCDDGNTNNGDGCSADCSSNETCGNGVIDFLSEGCDDGNTVDGDGCQSNCVPSTCGDGVVDMEFNEVCDDGESNSEDANAACRTNCQPSRCGDTRVDDLAGENCDDGNLIPGDGCSGACIAEVCGNGVVDLEFVGNGFVPSEECDDGSVLLNHDGCAATCLLEKPTWTEVKSRLPSGGRLRHAMSFDAARGRHVMFGGVSPSGNTKFDDTWEWDGDTWTQSFPVISPPTRINHAMVYDARRQRTILFGGFTSVFSTRYNDTWEWDGATWTEMDPVIRPSIRSGHAMIYDASLGKVMMFGGRDENGDRLGDTWEWDGNNWTEVSAVNSPPARGQHSMAYDAGRGIVVLYGGTGESKDTWEWDGNAWSVYSSTAAPSVESDLVFDGRRQVVLAFGDTGTWEWDGQIWSEIPTEGRLPTEEESSMAYDTVTGVTVLFAGEFHRGTWEWNGVFWNKRIVPTAQTSEPSSAITYDEARGRLIVLGVEGGQMTTHERDGVDWIAIEGLTRPPAPSTAFAYYSAGRHTILFVNGETWQWNGSDWTPIGTNTVPLSGTRLVDDPVRRRLVLFGEDGTWEWDGSDWELKSTSIAPSARKDFAMVYDPTRQGVLLFGGRISNFALGDTWLWDGTNWAELTPATLPIPRHKHAMAFDPAVGKVVMFGGKRTQQHQKYDDTWEWDGSNWVERFFTPEPDTDLRAMSYDGLRGKLLMFTGFATPALSYQYTANISENCTTGFDADRDGAIGCLDPDCWGRCTPECPPNSTPDWPNDCSTAKGVHRCGDGVCNNFLETPRLCPSDCGAPALVCGDFHCDAGEDVVSCPGDCTI